MTDTEPNADVRAKWGAWALLWFVPLYAAARIIEPGPLAVLVAAVGIFGVLALRPSCDRRERLVGVLATVLVLAVGLLAIWLLAAGWALLAMGIAYAAIASVLIVRHGRRKPPKVNASESEPSESLPAAPEPKPAPEPRPRTPAERRAANERRMAQGADEHRCRQAEQAAAYEREAEQRRQRGAERRLAEQRRGSRV